MQRIREPARIAFGHRARKQPELMCTRSPAVRWRRTQAPGTLRPAGRVEEVEDHLLVRGGRAAHRTVERPEVVSGVAGVGGPESSRTFRRSNQRPVNADPNPG